MIDFNTILNTLFQSAVEAQTKPLLEKIEEQEKRLTAMEEFFNKWNFGGEEKFNEAVKKIAEEVATEAATQAIDNADIESIVDNRIENKMEDIVSDEIERQMDKLDIDDVVRDALNNATVSISV